MTDSQWPEGDFARIEAKVDDVRKQIAHTNDMVDLLLDAFVELSNAIAGDNVALKETTAKLIQKSADLKAELATQSHP